jgi:hypothetical protein
VSCPAILARAGDVLQLLVRHRRAGVDVPLTGLQAIAEFRSAETGAVLLQLTEGAGLTTAGADGSSTVRVSATAQQTLALAPPVRLDAHDVGLAIRVFEPGDVPGTARTIADLLLVVRELRVALP